MTDHIERELERTRRQHVRQVLDDLSGDEQANRERRLLADIRDAERRGDVRRAVELKRELSRFRGVSTV